MTEDRVASPAQPPAAPGAVPTGAPGGVPTGPSPRDGAPVALLRELADRVDAGEIAPSDATVTGALRRAADELDLARQQADAALASALRWKERAVASWADNSRGAAADRAELVDLREHAHELSTQLDAMLQTLSWRVTAPLRGVRRLRPGGSR